MSFSHFYTTDTHTEKNTRMQKEKKELQQNQSMVSNLQTRKIKAKGKKNFCRDLRPANIKIRKFDCLVLFFFLT